MQEHLAKRGRMPCIRPVIHMIIHYIVTDIDSASLDTCIYNYNTANSHTWKF